MSKLLRKIEQSDYDGIEALFESHQASPLAMIKESNIHVPVIKKILSHEYPPRYLELFLKHGANKDCLLGPYQDTPLHYCIAYGLNEQVAILIREDADLNHQTSSGNTPLMTAIEEGNKEAVSFLLNKNVKLGIKNFKGETALSMAYACKDDDSARQIEAKLIEQEQKKRPVIFIARTSASEQRLHTIIKPKLK
jgi:ankyrin repeat protein